MEHVYVLSKYSQLRNSLEWSMLKCYPNIHRCVSPWNGACLSIIKASTALSSWNGACCSLIKIFTAVFLPGMEHVEVFSKHPQHYLLKMEHVKLLSKHARQCCSLEWSMLKSYQNIHSYVSPWNGACCSVLKASTALLSWNGACDSVINIFTAVFLPEM